MTPEDKSPNVHHQTARGARLALAKKHTSRACYDELLRGDLGVPAAKELGRDGAHHTPGGPEMVTDDPTGTPPQPAAMCWCGCGAEVRQGRRWRQGHDARAKGVILRSVRAGKTDELPEALRGYGAERGLLEG